MPHVDDIRKTRVHREAKEEGRQEERKRQLEMNRHAIVKLAAIGIPPERIAKILTLEIDFVRDEIAKHGTSN